VTHSPFPEFLEKRLGERMLRFAAAVAACTVIRCGSGFIGPDAQSAFPDPFVGTWRSVTPSFLFIRLSFSSSSSETCGVVARLTFSGVAWEGDGQITGDSLVLRMSNAGSATPVGSVVVHAGDAQTLRAEVRPSSGSPMDLTFVRDN
jgi:hypothetical protein